MTMWLGCSENPLNDGEGGRQQRTSPVFVAFWPEKESFQTSVVSY